MAVSFSDMLRASRRTGFRSVLLAGVALGTVALGAVVVLRAQAQIPTNVTPLPEFGAPARSAAPSYQPPAQLQGGVAENNENAIRILLQQASYWLSQYQSDKATESLTRVLQLDNANADALAMLAPIQAELGQTQAAQDSFTRLRATHPNDPRIASVETSLRAGELDQGQLAQARRLASEGHASDAVKAYLRVFKGDTPPPGLAIEYYQTLGGSEGGFDQGRDALARMVTQNPQDLRAQFAFAQIETFRESTRLDGIKRLELLVTKPAVAEQANKALRESLTWLPNDPSSVDSLSTYLARNPDDAEFKAKLEAARNPPGKARQDAFAALETNDLAKAEAGFQNALNIDPNDKDALGGLGLVRQRQGHIPEARELLSRAAQIDPGWEAALGGVNTAPSAGDGGNFVTGGGGGDGGAAARRAITAEWARVTALSNKGQNAQAEALLLKLMGRNPNWGNYLQLAALQANQGKLADAEANFRRSMRMNPKNAAPIVGLAGVLQREGKTDEADKLLARVGGAAGGAAGGNAFARADALRKQAEAEADPARRVALFQQAVDANPSFPWTRLELARALDAQNQHDRAREVMNGALGAHPAKDQVQAALIYAQERGDVVSAARIVQYVPAKDRTDDMRSLEQQAALRNDLTAATGAGDRDTTRARLLQVAARPDPSGARASEVARRLLAAKDKAGAREAIRLGLSNTPAPTSAQKLAYVGPLLDAGDQQGAAVLANQIDPAGLTPLQRQALDGARNGIAITTSDLLNQEGKRAAAYEVLAPRLASKPDAPDLNMALSRLYAADKKPEQAQRINETMLRRDPGDLDIRHAAVDSALQVRDFNHAEQLTEEARQQAPDDYRTQLMIADVERARNNPARALAALRRARDLKLQQTSGDAGG